MALKSKVSLTDANNQNRQILRELKKERHDEDNRLEKDYEIKENLGRQYDRNKEGFICLNKLERIFYYVKRINLARNISHKNNSFPVTSTSNER